MQFHIAQTKILLRTPSFRIQGVPLNNLAPMKNCPEGCKVTKIGCRGNGFSAEFFKMFWKKMGQFIVRSVNYGFSKGELSITQREGIITCIPK